MLLWTYETGDTVERYKDSIIISFKDDRKVLSTAHLNGGYRENLKFVFNHDINSGMGLRCDITPAVYEEHMKLIAAELGLDPEASAGLLTAAAMNNAAIRTASYEDLTVTAVVTGGIEMNGGRIGDPAFFHERQGETVTIPAGTINILLYINADLPEETLTRALVTCTEAKTAALQELMAGSCYSRGIATGSGTDGTVIICNSKSGSRLFYAGKHSKLGELIGITVKQAVKEALFLQTGLCPEYQFSLLNRLKRFGINEETLWQEYQKGIGVLECQGSGSTYQAESSKLESLNKHEFLNRLKKIEREEELVIPATLYVHLLDQLEWQLLSPAQAAVEGKIIIDRLRSGYDLPADFLRDSLNDFLISYSSVDAAITEMSHCFAVLTVRIIAAAKIDE
ncbi:MAG: adenosylcobinamide amidohydrolase [Dehalobacter sp. 4CP]|uniref:adenosylcobinamide amidohydrolase n=1 Tax=Dehalobacter sp. CP TaxID=2594474 RepID=UPI0013C958ED|nr:adenosylcobinamide amidohydrolase [Dehalobacter sp. 4CP]